MVSFFNDKDENIKGNRIILKPFSEKDLINIKKWGAHSNTLFCDYNLSTMSKLELYIWYAQKKKTNKRRYFAIYDYYDAMIGYIGVKDIISKDKKGSLGIVLDPNCINRGYGTESISLLLRYCKNELGLSLMELDVNEFNKRAIKAYEKSGFTYKTEYLGLFENQDIDFDDLLYCKYRDYFVIAKGKIYSRIYIMERKLT